MAKPKPAALSNGLTHRFIYRNAALRLGLGTGERLKELVAQGKITTLEVPGMKPKYSYEDIIAYLRSHVRPATKP